jgi:hypothetical protein
MKPRKLQNSFQRLKFADGSAESRPLHQVLLDETALENKAKMRSERAPSFP